MRAEFNTQAGTDWHVNILQEDSATNNENFLMFSFIFATFKILSNIFFFDGFIHVYNNFWFLILFPLLWIAAATTSLLSLILFFFICVWIHSLIDISTSMGGTCFPRLKNMKEEDMGDMQQSDIF